jgi:hypothetical protein
VTLVSYAAIPSGCNLAIKFGLSRVPCGATRTTTANTDNTSTYVEPGTSARYTASFACVMGYRVRPTISYAAWSELNWEAVQRAQSDGLQG